MIKMIKPIVNISKVIEPYNTVIVGFNGVLIALGIAGVLPPAASAMLHNLSTLGVSLHSMCALPEKR